MSLAMIADARGHRAQRCDKTHTVNRPAGPHRAVGAACTVRRTARTVDIARRATSTVRLAARIVRRAACGRQGLAGLALARHRGRERPTALGLGTAASSHTARAL